MVRYLWRGGTARAARPKSCLAALCPLLALVELAALATDHGAARMRIIVQSGPRLTAQVSNLALQHRSTLLANTTYGQGSNQFGGPAGLMTGASIGGGTHQYATGYDALLRATDLKVSNGSGSTTSLVARVPRCLDGKGLSR